MKGSSGTKKLKRWKWRKDNCRRDSEGKEKRAAGGNMMLIREVFMRGQAGSSHQEGKTHLESYQISVWGRRASCDSKKPEKGRKGEEEGEGE